MPIAHDGNEAISAPNVPRGTLGLTNPALPASFTACSAKTFLARSIPTNKIAMDFSFRVN